jgi:hypothetical protein
MYKAFVASTYKDLDAHRAHVIDVLQSAGFVVDPMEKWSADAKAPREFSADRLKDCSLCILLVAFRRGHVPEDSERSITQIEYDEARKRDIDVLPFLLHEGAAWSPEYDERESDPEVNRWRQYLQQHHGIVTFGPEPSSLKVESALARWVVEKESRRAERFRNRVRQGIGIAAALAVALIVFTVIAAYTPAMRSWFLSAFLSLHDPKIFNNRPKEGYELARIVPTRDALRAETKLSDELLGTQKTLDLLVNNAAIIHYDHMQNLRELLKRGVRIRVILWDYSDRTRAQYDAFCHAIKQNPEGNRGDALDTYQDLERMRAAVLADRKSYPGSLDFRWNSKPLFYTMWLRDAALKENAIGHLSVHFYRGQEYFPSLRVTHRDGTRMLENMRKEFEEAWQSSSLKLGS